MLSKEKVIESESVYNGKIVMIRRDKVITCNNNISYREIVSHTGGVGIVALTDDNKVCFVKQYRSPFDDFIMEIPAGKLERDEEIESAAARELSEETGYTAEDMMYMGYIMVSPGYCTEKVHLYLARKLTAGECHFDADENLEIYKYDFDEAVKMVMSGEISDAKTVCGILKAKEILKAAEKCTLQE